MRGGGLSFIFCVFLNWPLVPPPGILALFIPVRKAVGLGMKMESICDFHGKRSVRVLGTAGREEQNNQEK